MIITKVKNQREYEKRFRKIVLNGGKKIYEKNNDTADCFNDG